jgi:hypothetical protein
MSYRPSPLAHVAHTRVDVSLLSLTDRACLRLLEYSRVCTASQLATLIYPSLRTALRRTRRLAQSNLVTRESLPPDRGGIPLAYRLSSSGRRRIHLNAYRSPGLITTRHSLDGVEFVASLVRHDPGLVQLWWPEYLIPDFGWGVNPDHVVAIDTGEASAFLLVEVDESTERPPVIRDRLDAYARLFDDHRVGWHLLWVANSRERLARLRQIAGPTKHPLLSGRCWGVPIDDVADQGADAEVLAIGAKDPPRPLRGIATDPRARRSETEVGSDAWISLLANGGKEDVGVCWHGVERAVPTSIQDPEEIVVPDGNESEDPTTPAQSSGPEPDAPGPGVVLAANEVEEDADIAAMGPADLVTVLRGASGSGHRAERAAKVLADRGYWYHLLDALAEITRFSDPSQQLKGVHLIRHVHPYANDWLRRQAHELLLTLVDGQSDRVLVDAALAALDEAATRDASP